MAHGARRRAWIAVRTRAASTAVARADGPTSASCAEVNNTSRTRVLHTRYWPYSVSRFTKAITLITGGGDIARDSARSEEAGVERGSR